VDEEGIEAAAVTVIMAVGCGMPLPEVVHVRADHPFLYFLVNDMGHILFTGAVREVGNEPIEDHPEPAPNAKYE